MESPAGLRARLERLCSLYGPERAVTDPVQFPRRFRRDDDREAAAFISSALAYGRQAHIAASVGRLLEWLGPSPAGALRRLDPQHAARDLRGFVHRFSSGRDVACLFAILGGLLRRHGSLNEAFLEGYDDSHEDIGLALADFCRRALEVDVGPLAPAGRVPAGAGVRFFFSSPAAGSACKRLNMFLRWMVRRDDVDLGLWRGVSPSRLVIPLDTHVARVSRELGLSRRRSPDWRMAVEVTAALRRVDPTDPVRFDFALFNWGLHRGRSEPSQRAGQGEGSG